MNCPVGCVTNPLRGAALAKGEPVNAANCPVAGLTEYPAIVAGPGPPVGLLPAYRNCDVKVTAVFPFTNAIDVGVLRVRIISVLPEKGRLATATVLAPEFTE